MCGGQCVQQSFLLGSNENEIKSMSVCTQFAGKRRRRKEFIFAKNKAFKSHTIEIVNSCFVKWMTILCSLTLRRYTRMGKAYVDMFLFTIFILLFVTCEREKNPPFYTIFFSPLCVYAFDIYSLNDCWFGDFRMWDAMRVTVTTITIRYNRRNQSIQERCTSTLPTANGVLNHCGCCRSIGANVFSLSLILPLFVIHFAARAHTQKNGIWTKHIAFNLSRLSVYFKCFDTQNYLVLWQPK